MTDIIASVAWQCGEKDCAVQWHQANYWLDTEKGDCATGYTVDHYADGDHEEIEGSEVPSAEEVEASWRDYAKHVLATGDDPLGNYRVGRDAKHKEVWRFRFNNSILGPILTGAKRAGRDYSGRELPEHVRRYLNLGDDGRKLQDFASWQEFTVAVSDVKPLRWLKMEIDHTKPRNRRKVESDLKRAARKHLTVR